MRIHRSLWCLPLCLAACRTTSDAPQPDSELPQPEAFSPDAIREKTTIGVVLAQLDRSIQMWTQIFLNGSENTDGRRMLLLQESIAQRAGKLFYELVNELETGPPINRSIAAAAIGFIPSDKSLSPLLNALSDPDESVVSNALFGLAVLGSDSTPTGSLADLLSHGTTTAIRSNAALALLQVLRSGAEANEGVLQAARGGLRDPDPAVRAQSAMILAHQLDTGVIDELVLAMNEDPVPIAARAAAHALAYMASEDPHQKGRVARALTAALTHADGDMRAFLLGDLRLLAGRNYAKDEDWIQWAHRLPPG